MSNMLPQELGKLLEEKGSLPQAITAYLEDDEVRVIHRDGRGLLRHKRVMEAVAHALSSVIGRYAGAKIREHRIRLGLSLVELATMAGITPSKQRMREIELGGGSGLRSGTIYAIAFALGVDHSALMPTVEDAFRLAGIGTKTTRSIVVTKPRPVSKKAFEQRVQRNLAAAKRLERTA